MKTTPKIETIYTSQDGIVSVIRKKSGLRRYPKHAYACSIFILKPTKGTRVCVLPNGDIEYMASFDEITGQPGYIRIRGEIAKTKSKRIIPVSDNLDDWLRPMYRPGGKVIPDNVKWKIRHLIKIACEKAGVPWKPNALRHSFASYRLAHLGDAARTALEMGNSPNVIFKHYRELVTAEQAAGYWNIRPNTESKIVGMIAA